MTRTRAEVLLLLECAQIAAIIAFLVDLGLPWWTVADRSVDPGTITGWASLDGGHGIRGYAWFTTFGMIVILASLILRLRVLSYVAAGVAVLAAITAMVDVTHAQSIDLGRTHAGTWIGCLLLVIGAVAAIATGNVLTRRTGGWSVAG
jgi:hypothetical protein